MTNCRHSLKRNRRHLMSLMKLHRRHCCFLRQIRHYMIRRCTKICFLNCLNQKSMIRCWNLISKAGNNFLSCYRKSLTCVQVNRRNWMGCCQTDSEYFSELYWLRLYPNRCLLCCY